jgi:hypothetical protein
MIPQPHVLLAGAAALVLSVALSAPAAAVTVGHPQPMKVHSLARADPPGHLPPVQALAGAEANLAKPYPGTPVDVLSFHNDNWRTGWNPTEALLTPPRVASAKFGLLKTLPVDGVVMGQPLMVSNFTMRDHKKHNVLIVVTEHNSVYAFDDRTYDQLWKVNLGRTQSPDHVGCGDVQPELGIGNTPVILRNADGTARIYVITATEPVDYTFSTQLHELNLANGGDVRKPVEINPSAQLSGGGRLNYDAQNQLIRACLAAANGHIYVSIGSHCDHNAPNISGWVLSYSPSLQPQASFHTIGDAASYELASFWMTGFAPALDANGDLYAITGNGAFNADSGGHDYGQSFLHLKGDLSAVVDSFTPDNWVDLNKVDADFGSGGAMLIPPQPGQTGPNLAVGVGKSSIMYLLDAGHLGGHSSNDGGALQSITVGGSGLWGGPAYYVGPNGGIVFVQTRGDVLRSYRLSTGAQPRLRLIHTGTTKAGYGGSMPIISSRGAKYAVAWVVRRGQQVQLEAYDAAHLGAPIFKSEAGSWNVSSGNAFLSPLEANGRVYVGSVNQVAVFGMTD